MLTKTQQLALSTLISVTVLSPLQADDTIDELIVIGSRLDLQRQQMGSAVTVLTADDIANIGAAFVSDALRHVPGLSVSRTGSAGGLTQVRVRGSEANHVLVLIDGIEMNSPNGEFDFANLTTANIQRIEVLRGAQSGIYGSNATAGVINIVTQSPSKGADVQLEIESGSLAFNRQALRLNGGSESVQGNLSISHQRIAYNASENGNEDDLSENYSANSKISWQIADALSAFVSGYYNNHYFDTDDQLGTNAVDSNGIGDRKERAYQVGFNSNALNGKWINKLVYGNSRFAMGGIGSFGSFGDAGSREKLSVQSRYDFDRSGTLQQRVSVLLENENEQYRNTVPIDPSQVPEQTRRLRSAGIEYFADISNQLVLSTAVRSDNNDNFENASTYHIAGRWFVSDNASIHTSLGTGITNPSFTEQFGYFPGFYLGNPDLEPEQQSSWDIGWQHQWLQERLTTDITYFELTLENEIAGFTTPVNLTTESERQGFELSGTWQSTSGVSINATYTFTDATEANLEETRRPKNTGAIDVSIPFIDQALRAQVSVIYNGKMTDTDFGTFTRRTVEAYTLVNASIRYKFNPQVEAFVRLNNVFDEDYQEVIGYNTPGFHGTAGLAVSF